MMAVEGCGGSTGSNVQSWEPSAVPTASSTGDDERGLPLPMQALATSGDIGAQVSALILEVGHDQKKAARVAREAAETAQRAAEEHELQAMHDQAAAKLASGVLAGTVEIASAAVGFTGINGDAQSAELKSKLISGFGKIETTVLDYGADRDGRMAKAAGNAASREKTAVDDARDAEKDAKQTIDKALDLYKEYQTAKADAQRAAFLKA
jgi:hypothetical protein